MAHSRAPRRDRAQPAHRLREGGAGLLEGVPRGRSTHGFVRRMRHDDEETDRQAEIPSYLNSVIMPVTIWKRLWQWNAHRPGLSASKAKRTRPIGVTRTVSRTAPWIGRPSMAITWNAWPCRCIGWAIIEWLTRSISTRWPLRSMSGVTCGQYSPFIDHA